MDSKAINRIERAIKGSISTKERLLCDKAIIQNVVKASDLCIAALSSGKKILLAGNGGSAADAQHIAAELGGRFYYDRPGLPAMALTTDTSLLTAIGNDLGFDELFSRQLQTNAAQGDVFIGISTSGNSANVVNACYKAKELGVSSIGFTGEHGKLNEVCDVCISVPSSCTPRIQESHILLGHIICELIESAIFPR